MPVVPFSPLASDQEAVTYEHGPDSLAQPGVRAGTVREFVIDDSRAYPGTIRRVWVHTAAGHDPSSPAAVTLFNDGWWYLDPAGDVRAGIVLDNLAAQRAIPPMIGIFVDPGEFPGSVMPKNRNNEYDPGDTRYVQFLLDEVLPRAIEGLTFGGGMGICGGSSGGNAAFTAAWHRPDAIARVIAFNPSFAQMPGGNPYPALLADGETRRIRTLLHAAHHDIGWNDREENWFAESLETAAALARSGHDLRLVVGDGGHSPNHGGVLLPDALRWLWR
ncbi:enterochelin esterase [Microbacterium bovistercoris]|uniref:Enterochelin esterase n=1 Tax=Microbacterium bovistercoris TaxID=2293570 RepID=A0A371NXU7_9MICO|nr:alpha/beta hydrolase-fold protein [Microbacterium bovistercoris]REJ08214.1 enterochelin esterase [Microbacterium bovistercoris]